MDDPAGSRRRSERLLFLLLAVVIWPFIAVGVVAGWGSSSGSTTCSPALPVRCEVRPMSAADLPSRRELLTGRLIAPAPPEAHVSSLVVHVRPAGLPGVRAALAATPGVEIHAEAAGKLIVTLETATRGGHRHPDERDPAARRRDVGRACLSPFRARRGTEAAAKQG